MPKAQISLLPLPCGDSMDELMMRLGSDEPHEGCTKGQV